MLHFWIRLILLAAMMTSCGKDALEDGVEDFKEANARHSAGFSDEEVDAVPIEFALLGSGVAGLCVVFSNGLDPQIMVDQEFWDSANYDDRRSVVLHELGHCVIGRDHWDTELSSRPESLMFPAITDNMNYGSHEEEYQEELMTRTSSFGEIF